jgi:SAM-dependent methyltransferase
MSRLIGGYYRRAREVLLDRKAGVETAGRGRSEDVDVRASPDSDYLVGYTPTDWGLLRAILPVGEVSADDVFLDYGCGKGRVLLVAARDYPFKRVLGVELSEGLAATAERNVNHERTQLRCQAVDVINADATSYDLPDDVTIVYFNNPFKGPPFEQALVNINASLARAPRTIRMIYVNPLMHDDVLAAGFRVTRERADDRPPPWKTYVKSASPPGL